MFKFKRKKEQKPDNDIRDDWDGADELDDDFVQQEIDDLTDYLIDSDVDNG